MTAGHAPGFPEVDFLNMMFDEGMRVNYEWDPDIIEVQPISETRERIDNGTETGAGSED